MVISNHDGAVKMAKEEIAKGHMRTIRGVAEDIHASQEGETPQMPERRKDWYGTSGSSDDSTPDDDSDTMHGEP